MCFKLFRMLLIGLLARQSYKELFFTDFFLTDEEILTNIKKYIIQFKNVDFDNNFITPAFRRKDIRRKLAGKPNIFPLRKTGQCLGILYTVYRHFFFDNPVKIM